MCKTLTEGLEEITELKKMQEITLDKWPFIVMPTQVWVQIYDVCVDADCLLGMLEQVSTIGKKALPWLSLPLLLSSLNLLSLSCKSLWESLLESLLISNSTSSLAANFVYCCMNSWLKVVASSVKISQPTVLIVKKIVHKTGILTWTSGWSDVTHLRLNHTSFPHPFKASLRNSVWSCSMREVLHYQTLKNLCCAFQFIAMDILPLC